MPAEPAGWTLQVFARAPVEGEVKTRLIPALGVQGATDLYRRLVVNALGRACAARAAQVQLWIAGDPAHPFVQDCARRFRVPVFEQHGADLGQRMANAFAQAFGDSNPTSGCVLIGSDCPARTVQDLEDAAQALGSHDVVLQPAQDGGYVLIGLKRAQPGLFDAIEWGGPRVTEQTRQRATALGLAQLLLRPLPDLDSAADLQRALEHGWIDR
ncbi:MAG TPA: TIGR04282 family arsenosugar biosynthesis glycosyltransferase [Burkholderiaceae bacterium]|jgi:rSAM/selenodomain-associated transferase 1|nr:TIGR04282 family arsenosugar biosynthesis glycosyltransferase [Burkholderiaceae bacterium]